MSIDAGSTSAVDIDADALVIGGGFAGLVAAWELERRGRRALVLEAGDVLGGCVGTRTIGGLALDSGAESFAIARPSVLALAADLGLAGQVVAPAELGSWAWLGGRAVPLPPAGLLGVPVHPLSAPVRRALGPLGSARAALDRLLPASVGAAAGPAGRGGAATFGGIVRARMGGRVVERLVEPVVGGVHSASPDELDADVVAPGLRAALAETGSLAKAVATLRAPLGPAGAAVRGIDGGIYQLITALSTQLGDRTRVRMRAETLARDGERWIVLARRPDGSSQRIGARAVVIGPSLRGPVAQFAEGSLTTALTG
ncbi:MAG: FAD-dependent oxidoreductase, partial [Frankiaceae bacterium]|nr:FAD-dependent oxidoreductase [Frankiaceae bacterium]